LAVPCQAMREDASVNLEAIDRMLADFPDAGIVFIEPAGEKIPRKGDPGITKNDLFVINKTDLAPYVGANPWM